MDFGCDISPCQTIRPRISVYDGTLLSKLVMADTVGLRGKTPTRVFGAAKVMCDQVLDTYCSCVIIFSKFLPFPFKIKSVG